MYVYVCVFLFACIHLNKSSKNTKAALYTHNFARYYIKTFLN